MSAPLEHVLKLSDEQWVRLERITGRFEEAWREGSLPSIEAYLPSTPEERAAALIELVHAELELRLRAGEAARVEEYLVRFPELAGDASVVWDLITSELTLRRAGDPGLTPEEYIARFPGRESALRHVWESRAEAGLEPHPRSRDGPPAGESAVARIGKFAIEEVAGKGAFGIVYRAWDTEAQRPVALKVLRTEHLIHPEAVDRLLREARSMAGLVHPWIVEVYEAGWSGTTCYLASALISGSTLADCIARGGYSFRQTAELVCRVADALQFAHERGVVHRDLKPSNILIDLEGRPHITDFGLATGDVGDSTLTADGELLGTPAYMSPEQARGEAHGADGRTDIYSLGVVLYELLTGILPFRGSTRKILHQVLHAEPVPPRLVKESIPRPLEAICLKAMACVPSDRYTHAREMAEDLRRYLRGEPVRARRPRRWRQLRRSARQHPALAALLCAALLATVFTSAAIVWQRRRAEAALHVLAGQTRAAAVARQRLELVGYARLIALADREFASDNVVRAAELLEECPVRLRDWEWYYLKGRSRAPAHELHNHAGIVFEVAFSRDGRRLASAGGDQSVRLWDAATGVQLRVLRGHDAPVYGVNFAPDGKHLAAACGDGTVRVWEVDEGREQAVLRGHQGVVYSVCFSPDGGRLASAGADGSVRLWSVAEGRALRTLAGQTESVYGVTFHPDGRRIATAGGDGTARIWDAETGGVLRVLAVQPGAVLGVAFSPDGKLLASAGGGGLVKLWDVETGSEMRDLQGHTGVVFALSFSPSGKRLASAAADRTVKLWDIESGQELMTIHGYADAVWSVAFSPDGKRLASATGDGRVRLMNGSPPRDRTDSSLLTLHGRRNSIRSLAFSPDGKELATVGGGIVRIWDVTSAHNLRSLRGHAGVVFAVAFSPDGKHLATAGGDGTARIWDEATGRELLCLRATPLFPLVSVAFSPDGMRLASGGAGGVVRLWNTQTGQEPFTIPAQAGMIFGVAFTPDGHTLASAGGDGRVCLWDAATGRPLPGPPAHENAVHGVAFSPDGRHLAAVGGDGMLSVWERTSGRQRSIPLGTGGPIGLALAYSPDGAHIATADAQGTIRLWEAASGRPYRVIHGHTGSALAVAFSPDGHRVASCGRDRTAKLWSVAASPEP